MRFWPLYADDWRNYGVAERYYARQVYFDGFLWHYYHLKYGNFNRRMTYACKVILQYLALGYVDTLSSHQTWKFVHDSKSALISKVIQEKLNP